MLAVVDDPDAPNGFDLFVDDDDEPNGFALFAVDDADEPNGFAFVCVLLVPPNGFDFAPVLVAANGVAVDDDVPNGVDDALLPNGLLLVVVAVVLAPNGLLAGCEALEPNGFDGFCAVDDVAPNGLADGVDCEVVFEAPN